MGWGGDDATLIFLSRNFRERVNSILVVNNGSEKTGRFIAITPDGEQQSGSRSVASQLHALQP